MTKAAELYACLCAREFPSQALLRLRPLLRGRPCVVMQGEPPLEQVCSLTSEARILGLTYGMTRVEVETFSAILVLPRSPKEEAGARAILLECAGAFSPRVEERSEDGSFLCVLDIRGTEKLFGPPQSLAKDLLARIHSLGVTVSVAVSRNFHAAVCAAKGLSPQTARVIPVGEEASALAPLSPGVLNLTEKQTETFSLWGIRTLGMLAALPEQELIARMGQDGKRLRQLARGERQHLFQPAEPPFTLEEHMDLDSPVEHLDSLLFLAGVLLDQLIFRAKARVFALASVSITLALDRGVTHTRTVRLALPANDKHLWIKLLHLELEAHPPQAAVLALSMAAQPASASKVQLGLFSPQLPEPARLDVTLARIRALVGEENVGRAVLKDTHKPGEFRMEPFTPPSGSPPAVPYRPSRSAMRRLRPAEAIPVTVQGRRPKAFVFRKKQYVIEHIYGPWLISGDWWRPTLWCLEEWDLVARAQDCSLLCCCLVRDQVENGWRMAALYD